MGREGGEASPEGWAPAKVSPEAWRRGVWGQTGEGRGRRPLRPLRAGAWLSTGSLEMTLCPTVGAPFWRPQGYGVQIRRVSACSRPPSATRCVTLGKSSTISGLGGREGCSGQLSPVGTSHQGGGTTALCNWGPGGWRLGRDACVAKETGHHPSRRPGSVLNCLLHEARAEHRRWPEGRGRRAPAPAPTPPTLCPGGQAVGGCRHTVQGREPTSAA